METYTNYYEAKFARERKEKPTRWVIRATDRSYILEEIKDGSC